MAVKRRLQYFSGMRVDVTHLRSIESAVSYDFDTVLRDFVTGEGRPYILRGFNIVIPSSSVNAATLPVVVSDSAVLHSSANESGTILTIPAGTPNDILSTTNTKVIGSFQPGTINYVSLAYTRFVDPATTDQVSGWSESQKTEYQRVLAIGRVLDYQYIISTSGFSTNLPLFIVQTTAQNNVQYITNAQPSLFRLGLGGTVPDPYNSFNWGGITNPEDPNNTRQEWINPHLNIDPNPSSVIPGDDPLAFLYGDRSITNLKDWMDALMTRVKETTGSDLWYTDTAMGARPLNEMDIWWDSVGNVVTGVGNFSYNLVMEITPLTAGYIQTALTDSSIQAGDSYILGVTSGNKANVQTFITTQILINSLIRPSFVFNETLQNRRIVRNDPFKFTLTNDVDTPNLTTDALMLRNTLSTGPIQSITGWSFVSNLVTITCPAHGYNPGDFVNITNLNTTVYTPLGLNGVQFVKNVTTNTFDYTIPIVPSGVVNYTGLETVSLDTDDRLDRSNGVVYMPRIPIVSWDYNVTFAGMVTLTLASVIHPFMTGDTIVVTDLVAASAAPNGRFASITVNPDRTISYTPVGTPVGPFTVSSTSFIRPDIYTFLLTITGATPTTYALTNTLATAWSDSTASYVIGTNLLPAQPPASGAIVYDGVVAVTTVADPAQVRQIDNLATPNYEIKVTTRTPHQLLGPLVTDFTIFGDTFLSPYIRLYTHMELLTTNPPRPISTITQSLGTATVNAINHGFLAGDLVIISDNSEVTFNGPVTIVTAAADSFTFTYGGVATNGSGGEAVASNAIVSIANAPTFATVTMAAKHNYLIGDTIKISNSTNYNGNWIITNTGTYTFTFDTGINLVEGNVGAYVDDLCQFTLVPIAPTGTVIIPDGITIPYSWVNTGYAYSVFARYPNNPHPGPIQWDSDIFVKGIIGDKYFRIPQTATATPNSANAFNVDGLTGTAYLNDKEVAYVVLQRNRLVSNGSSYSCLDGVTVVGSAIPVDEGGNPLVSGDFVKFEGEAETFWIRIKGAAGTPIISTSFQLETDSGQAPTMSQRPPAIGKLRYCKGTYPLVSVAPHWEVPTNPDIYWFAVRRDNGSINSRVYLRSLELSQGETRQINNATTSNLLIYTGAGNEGAIDPNYTAIDPVGPYKYSQPVTIGTNAPDIDIDTRTIYFQAAPILGFQVGDKLTITIGIIPYTFTIDHLVTSLSVVVREAIPVTLAPSDVMTYFAVDYVVNDTDNLTLGIRKIDREDAKINTALTKPIYDESVYVQQINLNLIGTIVSGHYIYTGAANNPTALAWVMHGTATVVENVEDASVSMPGSQVGASSILVNIVAGTFNNGDVIHQNGLPDTGSTINNPANPPFNAPALPGGVSGIELVLPPNKRTQTVGGGGYVIWPTNSSYKQSADPNLTGEELLVIVNDTIRQAGLDYNETFGGPRAKIQVKRDLPPNTRMRFRIMSAYGSALAQLGGSINLQLAYNAGNIISTIAGRPVVISNIDPSVEVLRLQGSMGIEGRVGGVATGGIFSSVGNDQTFLIGKETSKPAQVWTGKDFVKTHSNYTGSAWSRFTAADISSGPAGFGINGSIVTVPDGKVARIAINATAHRTDALGAASFRIEGTFYGVGLNTFAAGSPVTTHFGGAGDGDQYAVSFGVAGNDVGLVVFGTVGSTIQWVFGIEYQMLQDAT